MSFIKGFFKNFFLSLLMSVLIFALLGMVFLIAIQSGKIIPGEWLEPVTIGDNLLPNTSSIQFVDNKGNMISNSGYVPLDELPTYAPEAFIIMEDQSFYNHYGFDAKGIVRALIKNLIHRGVSQGASTITQQLAKNLFLSHGRTLERKIKEVLYTIEIEKKFTKEEILEAYLNYSSFGHNIRGIEDASQYYFEKSARNLTLLEAGILSRIPNRPRDFNPLADRFKAVENGTLVLRRMRDNGIITMDQYKDANAGGLCISSGAVKKSRVRSDFVRLAHDGVVQESGIDFANNKSTIVTTTLDPLAQKVVDEALDEMMPLLQRQTEVSLETGVIVLDPQTGKVLAMRSSRHPENGGMNFVTDAKRSPGSTFKIFTYASAFEKGLVANSQVVDDTLTIIDVNGKEWSPKNYGHKFDSLMTVSYGLTRSKNVIAARVGNFITTPADITRLAQRCGIRHSRLEAVPSISIGTSLVTPLELASAYATFSNGGFYITPSFWEKMEIFNGGKKAIVNSRGQREVILNPYLTSTVYTMFRNVVEHPRGTAHALRSRYGIRFEIAGKTGTSSRCTDSWFVGFNSRIVVLAWVGCPDGSVPLKRHDGRYITGATGALPIVGEILKNLPSHYTYGKYPIPDGLEKKRFNKISGESDPNGEMIGLFPRGDIL